MSDNKLVNTFTDAATLSGLAAGYGWISKKVIKEPMTSDPSSNLINYVKFTVILAASIATKNILKIKTFYRVEVFYNRCSEICRLLLIG